MFCNGRTFRNATFCLGLVSVTVLALLTGCGGPEKNTTPPTTPPNSSAAPEDKKSQEMKGMDDKDMKNMK